MTAIDVLGPWMGLIGGAIAAIWSVFSLIDLFLSRPRIEVKIHRTGTGVENREHPSVAGWGYHNLRVRFRISNRGRREVSVRRVLLRSRDGDIIGTTCLERSSPTKEMRSFTLFPQESKELSLLRQRARSIVKADGMMVVLEVRGAPKGVLCQRPFILGVTTYPDESISLPEDVAE